MRILLALILLLSSPAVPAWAAPATAPYESFTLLMDTLSGPGQWSAQGHEATSEGLTVKGLNFGQTDGQPGILSLEEIFIKALPSKSQLEKLLTSWQGQPETVLAETVRLKGIHMDNYEPGSKFKGLIREVNLEGLKLAPAPAGADGAGLSLGAFKLAGFKSSFPDDKGRDIKLNLDEFSFSGLDAADYLSKILLVPDNPEEARDIPEISLADFFISPISLEEAALTGLDLDLPGLGSFKVAEMKATGPYRVGQVPALTKSWFNLELNLTGDPQAAEGTPDRDIYEFRQQSGLSALALEAETESAYEAETGTWTARLSRLSARDLFDLSLSLAWGGLTPDRLEKFKMIPLSGNLPDTLGDILGDSSFKALNLKYTDQGLVDQAFNLAAKEEGKQTGAELKALVIAMEPMLRASGAEYLKNPEAFSQPLLDFLKGSPSLEIDLKPTPPLTFKAAADPGGEPSTLLDALNITLSANGQAGPPLRFVPGLGGLTGPGEGDSLETRSEGP